MTSPSDKEDIEIVIAKLKQRGDELSMDAADIIERCGASINRLTGAIAEIGMTVATSTADVVKILYDQDMRN
jgi:hypothetical protein